MVKILERLDSEDGATKYLFGLSDDLRIESVFLVMDHVGKDSICVSSQVGCPYTCTFCSTGLIGYKRNLAPDEIVEQVTSVVADKQFTPRRKFDIKYMGMGEPLLNIDSVVESKNQLRSRFPGIKFHLSTAGVAPKIRELEKRSPDFGLQISLHAPTDELRTRIMPINGAYPIAEVLSAGEVYAASSPLSVTLNYCMMRGINDQVEHARQLAALLCGRQLRVQLVNFNPHISIGYEPTTQQQIDLFISTLAGAGVPVHHGLQLGKGSGAGCGQLDADYQAGELKVRTGPRTGTE